MESMSTIGSEFKQCSFERYVLIHLSKPMIHEITNSVPAAGMEFHLIGASFVNTKTGVLNSSATPLDIRPGKFEIPDDKRENEPECEE